MYVGPQGALEEIRGNLGMFYEIHVIESYRVFQVSFSPRISLFL
jgi:hypothetical protein